METFGRIVCAVWRPAHNGGGYDSGFQVRGSRFIWVLGLTVLSGCDIVRGVKHGPSPCEGRVLHREWTRMHVEDTEHGDRATPAAGNPPTADKAPWLQRRKMYPLFGSVLCKGYRRDACATGKGQSHCPASDSAPGLLFTPYFCETKPIFRNAGSYGSA